MTKHAIAIHGGAGTILRNVMTPELEHAYRAALEGAISLGDRILSQGGSALDAVTEAVVQLENNELFNAGKGSVFNHEGKHEMDAAVMDGKSLLAGSVSGIKNIKNPILLARAVMDKSEHVFLANNGAADFAIQMNIEMAPDDYFFVQHRYDQYLKAKEVGQVLLDHTVQNDKKFGTVGAVALDRNGDIAAATSTGGMTNKRWGRVGDSPIIGAGTYANNNTCAISCTGHGEFFIRAVVAYDISCMMEYGGLSLQEACKRVVNDKLVKMGGEGGLIAIDTKGNIELPFNSAGMYRASMREGEQPYIGIYRD